MPTSKMMKQKKKTYSPLRKLAMTMFNPEGKNPFYKGDLVIPNFKELVDKIDHFNGDDAMDLSQWINYLGDEKCSRDIAKSPNNFSKIIKSRYDKLFDSLL